MVGSNNIFGTLAILVCTAGIFSYKLLNLCDPVHNGKDFSDRVVELSDYDSFSKREGPNLRNKTYLEGLRNKAYEDVKGFY